MNQLGKCQGSKHWKRSTATLGRGSKKWAASTRQEYLWWHKLLELPMDHGCEDYPEINFKHGVYITPLKGIQEVQVHHHVDWMKTHRLQSDNECC